MKTKLRYFIGIYLILVVLTLPFEQYWWSGIAHWVEPLSLWAAQQTATLLGIKKALIRSLSSDTLALYLHLLNLTGLSLLFSIGCLGIRSRLDFKAMEAYITVILGYYLSFQFLNYAVVKLLGLQFPIPEPNLLFTPLGALHKDILYWSTMGASYPYVVVLGVLEGLVGVLLLVKKTRLIGVYGALILGLHIFAVNVCYDISVKVLAFHLLLMALYLSAPSLKAVYKFITQDSNASLSSTITLPQEYPISKTVHWAMIVFTLVDLGVNFPYQWRLKEYQTKIPLHGAYQVLQSPSGEGHFTVWSKVFIHNAGYFILEMDTTTQYQDFPLQIDTLKHELFFNQNIYSYHYSDKYLQLIYQNDTLYLEQIPLETLPLLKPEFHWMVDEISDL